MLSAVSAPSEKYQAFVSVNAATALQVIVFISR